MTSTETGSDTPDVLPCPFCGSKAYSFYEFDMPRGSCSDDKCPASFGDFGIDAHLWNTRSTSTANKAVREALKRVHDEYYDKGNLYELCDILAAIYEDFDNE